MSKNSFVYISSHDGPDGGGIYEALFDKESGNISTIKKMAGLKKSGFMALHPFKDVLYIVCVNEKADTPNGCIAAYSIDHITGELKLINKLHTGAGLPTFLSITKDGQYLFQVSFTTASGSVIKITDDGSLQLCGRIHTFTGSGPNPVRQTKSTPHCISMHPKYKTVFVCDLGADRITGFRLDEEKQDLVPLELSQQSINPGAGPRHMRFTGDGKWAYVINELDNTISVYCYDQEKEMLEPVQVVSTLPDGMKEAHKRQMASELMIHPNQTFIYVTNRSNGDGTYDGIGVFGRDTETGKLSPIQFYRTGKHPRHFNMDKEGQWLFISARDSDQIQRFRIDNDTGELQESMPPVTFRQPWDIQFYY
jgi:6-phosphogluconolactonase